MCKMTASGGFFMIETRLLQYFLAVAREQNITRAAESLHIAQPTLSKQMMELEQQLGKPLFIRGKKKITLTDEGAYFRSRAQRASNGRRNGKNTRRRNEFSTNICPKRLTRY